MTTYTFSRALHMMRYSGAKMRPVDYDYDYFYIENDCIFIGNEDESKIVITDIETYLIMDNWVEAL